MRFRLSPVAVLAATMLSLSPAVIANASPSSRKKAAHPARGTTALRAGCDRSRPAVAHHSGGVRITPQPPDPPIPCMTFVGRSAETATTGITRSGALVYAAGIDNTANPPQNVLTGPEYVLARATTGARGRGSAPGARRPVALFLRGWTSTRRRHASGFSPPEPLRARISWSDDDGVRWQTSPGVGCPGMGSERVLEGPAPRGGAEPSGYPHVVYYCGNGTDVAPSVVYCYRSLDGGRRFAPLSAHPDPPGKPGSCGIDHAARPGTVGPNGFLYFTLDLCGKLGVAISRDEGASWQHIPVAVTHIEDMYISSITTDAAGNVYIAWLADTGASSGNDETGRPYLTISRDHGRTWSRPMMIAAPGVTQARHEAVTATGDGHIAISYLGSTDRGVQFNGYITESFDALALRPMFWSAAVDSPRKPFIKGSRAETFGNRLFVISDTFSRSGTPWAACQCDDEPACPYERVGIAASLARP